MVAAGVLATDILETAVYFAAPTLAWLFVFVLGYADPDLATSSGFDRRTFWLLIPGALVGEFANVLFFGFGSDLLAINIGGGLIPVLLSIWLLGRVLPESRRSVAEILGVVALATGLALAVVELDLRGPLGLLGPGLAALAPCLAMFLFAVRGTPAERRRSDLVARTAALFGLTVFLTQLTTSAIPGLGIVSIFPAYLLAPLGVGALAAILLGEPAEDRWGPGLAVAYAATTFGVLVGADVLHQPPLYGAGSSALYAIGGAGIVDLVHLSGLLGLVGAYAVVLYARRGRAMTGREAPGPASPSRLIRRAWYRGLEGRFGLAMDDARTATEMALADARRLHGLPPPDGTDGWAGLPEVPPWVPVDHANLRATASERAPTGRESYRTWLTAKALVGLAGRLANRRRARAIDRAAAFAVDLGLLAVGFAAVDDALFVAPGAGSQFLNGLAFNAAVVGAIGWGVGYFLLFEGWSGTTPGKRFLGLAVRTPEGNAPGFREVWIRNLPRVVPVSILAYGIAFGFVALRVPGADTNLGGGGDLVSVVELFVVGGFLLSGLLSWLTIVATDERQRLGDLLAGTWVVRVDASRPARRPGRRSPFGAAGWWRRGAA